MSVPILDLLGRRRLRLLDDKRPAAVAAEINRCRLPFHGLYGVLSPTRLATWGTCWQTVVEIVRHRLTYGNWWAKPVRPRAYIRMNAEARSWAVLSLVMKPLGRREDAERTMAAAIPAAETRPGSHTCITRNLRLEGRLPFSHNEAVRWLTKAVDEGYASYPRFSTDQSLARLKGHAGFAALLARLRQDRDRWQQTL
jgi:hypothetical protein